MRIREDKEDIVIMTRNPWEVYHSTRYRAIQIPNEDLHTIYEVAQKLGVSDLLLAAPRKALGHVHQGIGVDTKFPYLAQISDSDMKLFRIALGG